MNLIELVCASSFYEPPPTHTPGSLAMWIGFVVTYMYFDTGSKTSRIANKPVTVAVELKQAPHRERRLLRKRLKFLADQTNNGQINAATALALAKSILQEAVANEVRIAQ